MKIQNDKNIADLICKSVDGHYYLYYKYSHPKYIKTFVAYSQALRWKKNCSVNDNFKKHTEKPKTWFRARKYRENLLNQQMDKFMQNSLLD